MGRRGVGARAVLPSALPPLLAAVLLLLTGPAGADRVTAVQIEGLSGALEKNARQYLTIEQTRVRGAERSASFVRYQFEEGVEEIRAALEPLGHYQPTIEPTLAAGAEPETWVATYRVTPGPQVRFGAVTVDLGEAGEDPGVADQLATLAPRPGDPFTHTAYEASKKALLDLLARRGYFDNRLRDHRVVVDPAAGTADVVLAFASGPRYRFGETRFEGSQFDDDFMARFGRLPVGEPFRDEELVRLQRNLVQVAYFAEAYVDARVEEANDRNEVPIVVTTTPNDRRRYTAGINFGTDSGVGVQGTALWRWINDRGHAVDAEFEFGTRNRRLIGGYTMPGRDLDTTYTLGAGFTVTETDAYIEERTFLSGRRAHRWHGWDVSEAISINDEQFDVAGIEDRQFYMLGELTAERSAYDDRLFTRRGWQLRGALRGTHESALSDFSLLQLELRGIWIRSLGERNRVLLRGQFGATETDELDAIPASLRFFAGGDRSVRGFDFESLGPRNDEGQVIGGANVIVGSATVEHYFSESWGIAGFVDAGNAFDTEVFEPAYGAGLGLRWISPVGLVRVDIAVGLEEEIDAQEFRIHLNIGPDL